MYEGTCVWKKRRISRSVDCVAINYADLDYSAPARRWVLRMEQCVFSSLTKVSWKRERKKKEEKGTSIVGARSQRVGKFAGPQRKKMVAILVCRWAILAPRESRWNSHGVDSYDPKEYKALESRFMGANNCEVRVASTCARPANFYNALYRGKYIHSKKTLIHRESNRRPVKEANEKERRKIKEVISITASTNRACEPFIEPIYTPVLNTHLRRTPTWDRT